MKKILKVVKIRKIGFPILGGITSSKYLFLFFIFLGLFILSKVLVNIGGFAPENIYFKNPNNSSESNENPYIPVPTPFNWTVENVDGEITRIALPPDSRMSTPDELYEAINNYRSAHGVNRLQKSDFLCSVAENRAVEQVANGGLDGHAGFEKYAKDQNEFGRMGEVLFGGVQPQYGVHIVEFGWDRSLTGHREAIRDPNWQAGCGGIADYFAVFVFGTP